jgi:hypothetical protein
LEEIVGIGLSALYGHGIGQLLGQHLQQAVVFRAEHLHVHVVGPRDEALVSGGTQQCATDEPEADMVFLADAMKLEQEFEHAFLMAAQLRTLWIETCPEGFGGGWDDGRDILTHNGD